MKSFSALLFWLLLSSAVFAQPVSDANGTSTTGNTVTSLTISNFSVPANDDRLLVVCTLNSSNAVAPTVTFMGNNMTNTISRSTTSGIRLSLYSIILGDGMSATSGNITASGSSLLQLGASSYHGVDQTTPIDGAVSSASTGGSLPSSLSVSSRNGDLTCDCIGAFATAMGTLSVVAGQTQIFQTAASSPNTRMAMSTETGAASVG